MHKEDKAEQNWRRYGPQIEALYEQYRGLMYSVVYQTLGRANDADDIVHNAVLRIAKAFDRIELDNPHRLRGLIATITRYEVVNHLRRNRRECAVSSEMLSVLADHASPADEGFSLSESQETIVRYVSSMNPKYETAFVLKYVYDLPDATAARIMDINPGALRVRLSRARKKLNALLKEDDAQEAIGSVDLT